MALSDPKADLQRYLQAAREAMLWKLDGVSEYDARRPLTPTGTNLLGLVKHVANVEAGYFGDSFGRHFPVATCWGDEFAYDADLFATADETRDDIVALYRGVWGHADAVIEELPLDAEASVPWWAEDRRQTTLHRLLVHVVAETNRHAGHADILRESIDGAAGLRPGNDNLVAAVDSDEARDYTARLEQIARSVAGLD